jgi:hypothetical protein
MHVSSDDNTHARAHEGAQVLATDMGEHMAIVSKLKTEVQRQAENPNEDMKTNPPEALKGLLMQVVCPAMRL